MSLLNRLKVHPWLLVSLSYIILVMIFGLMYCLRNAGFALDDSYITYRYAYHLSEGYGLVFNVGEAYYGTTAAGYAVILAIISVVVAKLGLLITIPSISIGISAVSLMIVAMLLPVITKARNDWRLWLLSVMGALIIFFSLPFNEAAGHETYPFLSVALLGTVLVSYFQAYLLAGFFLALAATFRPDAILLGGIIPALDWVFSGMAFRDYFKNRNIKGFLVIYFLVLASWFTYLGFHFGTPMPGTMAAKKAQFGMGNWLQYTPSTMMEYVVSRISSSFLVAMFAGLAAFGYKLIVGTKRDHKSENLLASTWLTYGIVATCAYFTFKVTFWPWYGIPFVFSISVVVFVGWSKIINGDFGRGSQGAWFTRNVCNLMLIVLVLFIARDVPNALWREKNRIVSQHISAYSEIVDYIRAESPEGAVIQMPEPGAFGYNLGPKYIVVDELGLTSPGVAQALIRGDYTWTLNQWHPDYLICSWDAVYSACSQNIDAYEYVGDFNRRFWVQFIKTGARLFRRKDPFDG